MYKYVEYYASKAAISLIAKSKMLTNAYNLLYSAIFNVINVGMSVMMLNVSGKVAGLLGPAAGEVLDFVFTTGKAVINAMIAFSPAMIGGAIAALTNPMSLAQIISMDGLSEEVMQQADGFLKIPMVGYTESLNISVSAAIIIQDVTNRLRQSDINWQLSEEEVLEKRLDWTRKSIKDIEFIERKYFELKENVAE